MDSDFYDHFSAIGIFEIIRVELKEFKRDKVLGSYLPSPLASMNLLTLIHFPHKLGFMTRSSFKRSGNRDSGVRMNSDLIFLWKFAESSLDKLQNVTFRQ